MLLLCFSLFAEVLNVCDEESSCSSVVYAAVCACKSKDPENRFCYFNGSKTLICSNLI